MHCHFGKVHSFRLVLWVLRSLLRCASCGPMLGTSCCNLTKLHWHERVSLNGTGFKGPLRKSFSFDARRTLSHRALELQVEICRCRHRVMQGHIRPATVPRIAIFPLWQIPYRAPRFVLGARSSQAVRAGQVSSNNPSTCAAIYRGDVQVVRCRLPHACPGPAGAGSRRPVCGELHLRVGLDLVPGLRPGGQRKGANTAQAIHPDVDKEARYRPPESRSAGGEKNFSDGHKTL